MRKDIALATKYIKLENISLILENHPSHHATTRKFKPPTSKFT